MEDSTGRWKRGGGPRQGGRGWRGSSQHRGRGGRTDHDRGNKRKDLGRQAYFKKSKQLDRRDRNDADNAKRQKLDEEGSYAEPDEFSMDFSDLFTKEEIEDEEKRPKRKVAVMIGYSGTGYKGMQFVPKQPTIERDLFRAFILAGAISKANANDPKKSSFVRCARTDKGVHAAGNMISLKLVVEDDKMKELTAKINSHLPNQIRVWGIERTIGSFSCYQACDSRWYEYLIPTHALLPPHPSTYLARRLREFAEEAGDLEGYSSRQEEVSDWWEQAERKFILPILNEADEDIRAHLHKALFQIEATQKGKDMMLDDSDSEGMPEEAAPDDNPGAEEINSQSEVDNGQHREAKLDSSLNGGESEPVQQLDTSNTEPSSSAGNGLPWQEGTKFAARLEDATKRLRTAYQDAKSSYRLSPARLERVRATLAQYQGTFNFHNYTIRKAPSDPSATRHIKSFAPFRTPTSTNETGTFIIGDTEWLSVKVHGQSFMMHQIRKMIGMAVLIVRSGCVPERIRQTLASEVIVAIPKAPALGLLLERPVFDTYNLQRAAKFGREALSFDPFAEEMGEFKEREIYQRIYAEEEKDHIFHTFFAQIDNFRSDSFLYLSSKGLDAVPGSRRKIIERQSDSYKKRTPYGIQHFKKPKTGETADAAADKSDHEEDGDDQQQDLEAGGSAKEGATGNEASEPVPEARAEAA